MLPATSAREWPILAQLVALDKVTAATLVVAAAVAALIAWLRPRQRVWAAGVTAVMVMLALLFGARVLAQGVNDGTEPSRGVAIAAVSWNADGVDAMQLAEALHRLVEASGADIIVLPETGWKSGELVEQNLDDLGTATVAYAPEWTATSVLLSRRLAHAGEYRVDDDSTPPWAGLVLLPAEPSAQTPVIVATHLQQPSPGSTHLWREHLDWVETMCATSPYVIVIGDMNSTVNNLGGDTVGDCTDVAAAHGAGAASTWPTTLPPWLGVSIDRFMVGSGFDAQGTTFRVVRDVQVDGSDHWPIVVSFSRRSVVGVPGADL